MNNYNFIKIGNYDFSGSVDITDPCYDHAVWCRMNDVMIAPGNYLCAVRTKDMGIWGTRVYTIGIYNVNEPVPALGTMRIIGHIGVDAGLAGFFHEKPDFSDDEWNTFCDTLDRTGETQNNAWILCNGFFSSSGYGDGSYYVYAYNNAKGEISALEIRFLDDDDDEDYDEEC